VGQLDERLGSCTYLGLDTSLFIYHLEQHPRYLPLTQEIFSSIEAGHRNGITSTITLLEIIVKPLSLGKQYVARKYEALLMNFPNLEIVDLDRDVIRQAALLRAEYHLRPPDALQVSAWVLKGAEVLITNDRQLEGLGEKLSIIILDDLL
jgi:predicted nucleic acid-binding protein